MTHQGFTLWLTGMSGAGKSTISDELMSRFRSAGAKVELLDGDIVRTIRLLRRGQDMRGENERSIRLQRCRDGRQRVE